LKRSFLSLRGLLSGLRHMILFHEYNNRMENKVPSHLQYKDGRSLSMQSFVEKRIKVINSRDQENPSRYNSSYTNNTLKMALTKLNRLTERLIVMDLPETPVYDKIIAASEVPFDAILDEAVPAIEFYKCNFLFSDPYDGFVDTIHVNSEGRQHLTAELIDILNGQSRNTLCNASNIN